jgi:hypothetical protein
LKYLVVISQSLLLNVIGGETDEKLKQREGKSLLRGTIKEVGDTN